MTKDFFPELDKELVAAKKSVIEDARTRIIKILENISDIDEPTEIVARPANKFVHNIFHFEVNSTVKKSRLLPAKKIYVFGVDLKIESEDPRLEIRGNVKSLRYDIKELLEKEFETTEAHFLDW